tara:strand:+ start:112 stop:342 length:231 start_codon:yes stop_codon:yes gene_type:complete
VELLLDLLTHLVEVEALWLLDKLHNLQCHKALVVMVELELEYLLLFLDLLENLLEVFNILQVAVAAVLHQLLELAE